MPARFRRILMTLFAAAYAFLATAGPALHALPGLGHDVPLSSHRDDATGGEKAAPPAAHDDCPVCNLHAQASLLLVVDRSIVVDVVAIRPAEPPPAVAPATVDGPSASRAPPAVA